MKQRGICISYIIVSYYYVIHTCDHLEKEVSIFIKMYLSKFDNINTNVFYPTENF